MNLIVNNLPINWKQGNFLAFANWYKLHIKSPLEIEDDYYLLKQIKK